MVYRVYVEKKEQFAHEANKLLADLVEFCQVSSIENLRVVNRYDCTNLSKSQFDSAINSVFSEPQVDVASDTLLKMQEENFVFAVEYLPGQFDQRANSASECIQLITKGERPIIKTSKVYILCGKLSEKDKSTIKEYVINPIEMREATLDTYDTLDAQYEKPQTVAVLNDFITYTRDELKSFIDEYGLAMDIDDITFCQQYFASEKRNPTITEIKVLDTYWSDHCRHTTFMTMIDDVKIDDPNILETYNDYLNTRNYLNRNKPITLMDLGTIGAKYLKKKGLLENLDESDEINACTVKIKVKINDEFEDWLLLFKNETHNHPTEIEPFGGAATCLGGAIRDPLSGRSYVYAAMRVTGAANPLSHIDETLEGKLPQRKIVTTAASGYSSYGNQIGLATGQVEEIYHEDYIAKRMEVGAVIAAAPAANVVRKHPAEGDVVILIGGKTGRDGCGGATGSSKAHTLDSLDVCGAEVQKGNPPEERKIQRLFRNSKASQLIKKCNDFGAGGVAVAIGELADALEIDLNKVPTKYDGLDGTELAISESQERVAVVIEKDNVNEFIELCEAENVECSIVAKITSDNRMKMTWNGEMIVDISRDFLDNNGVDKHISIEVTSPLKIERDIPTDFNNGYLNLVNDLNVCSKRGLSEMFDSTVGAGTVLMPFGGKHQKTPLQSMVHLISVEEETTSTCSVMSYGFNPYISKQSPYHGAYFAVVESLAKIVATGAGVESAYLSFQEYFPKLHKDPKRWGLPLASLLGAFKAQKEFGIAAIGGKDSMSGSFEELDVPPTLISFAVSVDDANSIISPEFKKVDNNIFMLTPEKTKDGLLNSDSLNKLFADITDMIRNGTIISAYTPTYGGTAEAIYKMAIGNRIGFEYNDNIDLKTIFDYSYGSFILEVSPNTQLEGDNVILLGKTTAVPSIKKGDNEISLDTLESSYEELLESVYPLQVSNGVNEPRTFTYTKQDSNSSITSSKVTNSNDLSIENSKVYSTNLNINQSAPRVLIPVFPGTNCEYESAKAFASAGAIPDIFVINNLNANKIAESVNSFAAKIKNSQIIFIPGGFSGGDEPDGSGKFITAFFRNQEIKDSVTELLDNRDGLMAGICNGFQALIKLGLLPYGRIIDCDESMPTLTHNQIGRHQSKIVRTRVSSNKSPWLSNVRVGDVYNVPISHGEGRFIASENDIAKMAESGQIITQYVDLNGKVTSDIQFNPNGSYEAIEGIVSPDGRILGKMGHSERIGKNLYKNVSGEYDMQLFKSAVEYFK